MQAIRDSRSALSRARFFLEKAKECPADARIDFEAFLEASIVFARAAMHRIQTRYRKHQNWKVWWDSLLDNPSVTLLREERDWILKEASPKIGQKIFMPSIGPSDADIPAPRPYRASEFYYFETPDVEATATVETHLIELEKLLIDAEERFSRE
jgi:hypothetical protein